MNKNFINALKKSKFSVDDISILTETPRSLLADYAKGYDIPNKKRGPLTWLNSQEHLQRFFLQNTRKTLKTNEENYLDLKTLSSHTCLSVRTLWDYLIDQYHPLPHFKLAGKILIRWRDFEDWISRYKVTENIDIDHIVKDVCE